MTLQAIVRTETPTLANKLFVCLHGWGDNARGIATLADELPLLGCHLYFPEAPFPHPYSPSGRMWYGLPETVDFGLPSGLAEQPDLQESRQRLQTWLVQVSEETGVPFSRTVLAGFSQGGAMALDVGLALPLAGVIVLSGYLHSPPTCHETAGPVLMLHGVSDPVVPIAVARTTYDILKAQSVTLEYEEFAMGHQVSGSALRRMTGFLQTVLA